MQYDCDSLKDEFGVGIVDDKKIILLSMVFRTFPTLCIPYTRNYVFKQAISGL